MSQYDFEYHLRIYRDGVNNLRPRESDEELQKQLQELLDNYDVATDLQRAELIRVARDHAQKFLAAKRPIELLFRNRGIDFDAEGSNENLYREAQSRGEEARRAAKERLGEEAAAAPDIQERERFAEQVDQASSDNEIRDLLFRARSALRLRDYEQVLDLTSRVLNLSSSKENPLAAEMQHEAQLRKDRDEIWQRLLSTIRAGKWDEALRDVETALTNEDFMSYQPLITLHSQLEEAIKAEKAIEKAQQEIASNIDNLDKLKSLRSETDKLTTQIDVADLPTERQEHILEKIDEKIDDALELASLTIVNHLSMANRLGINLSQRENEANRAAQLYERIKGHLQKDSETHSLYNNITKTLADLQIEKQRLDAEASKNRRRNYAFKWGLRIVAVFVLLLVALVALDRYFTRQYDMEQESKATRVSLLATQEIQTATDIARTIQYENTQFAQQQTLEAQNRLATETTIARENSIRSTDIALTFIAGTAEAAAIQTRAAESNQSTQTFYTQVARETGTAIYISQLNATATIQSLELLTALAPTPTPLYQCLGEVALTSGVNVREQPSVSSAQVGQVAVGWRLEVYEFALPDGGDAVDGWYRIIARRPEMIVGGWVAADFVVTAGCPSGFGPTD
ncbi:MAG: hypothetical protein CL607_18925 [Anaerolineaceae bacterium]|nr:hypothetical protein [Anaerolineaceae bacterium]